MESLWEQGAISIVLLPDRSHAEEIFGVVKRWTREGLITPAIWVFPENVALSELTPPSVKGIVLGVDEENEVQEFETDLFDQLGRKEFRNVRLLSIHQLREGYEALKSQQLAGAALSDYINWSLPGKNSVSGIGQNVTNFYRINLMVAPAGMKSATFEEAFESSWDANVIASPEDRSSPWSGDRFLRDDNKFPIFAAMHIVSVGALWSGVNTSPFELIERDTSQTGKNWISRVFVSAILTEGLSRRIASKMLDKLSGASQETFIEEIYPSIVNTAYIPDEEIDNQINTMLDFILKFSGGELSFLPYGGGEAPTQRRWFEWEQIKRFLVFSGKKLAQIPRWAWRWVRIKFGAKLQKSLQGEAGMALVGIDPTEELDLKDYSLFLQLESITSKEESAKKALVAPFISRITKTSPKLWQTIRELIFGMLDGSDLGEARESFKNVDDRQLIFLKPSQLVQDPIKEIPVREIQGSNLELKNIPWDAHREFDRVLISYHSEFENLSQEESQLLLELSQLKDQLDRAAAASDSKEESNHV